LATSVNIRAKSTALSAKERAALSSGNELWFTNHAPTM
jgi:hypothetical protein